MKIKIVAVGKIKEGYFKKAIEESINIIKKRFKIEIIEVSDEKTVENPSIKEKEMILKKESERINSKLDHDDYRIALDIAGIKTDEKRLRKIIKENIYDRNIVFIIGGSLGLHEDILNKSNEKISFSNMTFPHQMVRVLLLSELEKILQ